MALTRDPVNDEKRKTQESRSVVLQQSVPRPEISRDIGESKGEGGDSDSLINEG